MNSILPPTTDTQDGYTLTERRERLRVQRSCLRRYWSWFKRRGGVA